MELFGIKSLDDTINYNKENIIKVCLLGSDKNTLIKLKTNNIPYTIVSESFFSKYNKINHQFIFILIKKRDSLTLENYLSKEKKQDIILVVDCLEDPFNFGNIIRTAAAFNVGAIIYKKDNQVQVNDYVIKSSTGAVSMIDLIKVTNIVDSIKLLKNNKYWIYSSILDKDAKDANKIDFDKKTVIIVGNEENGISKSVIDNSDFKVYIPIEKVQSLNVSTATGILLNIIKNCQK